MGYAFIPLDTATGPGWQYRIERGDTGVFTPWRNWNEDPNVLAFTEDPSGGDLLTDTLYWVYARNSAIPSGQPGSIESELAASIVILPSGAIVPGSPNGTPTGEDGNTGTQKSLLQLSLEANQTTDAFPAGQMASVKTQFAYKLNELVAWVIDGVKTLALINGARLVYYHLRGQQSGINHELQKTDGNYEFGAFDGFNLDGNYVRLDKFGNQIISQSGATVINTPNLFVSNTVRVKDFYVINQEELTELADYDKIGVNTPYGPLGAFKSVSISANNLFRMLLERLQVVFTGEVVVRTSARTTLPANTVAPTHFLAPELDATGKFNDRFVPLDAAVAAMMPSILVQLAAAGISPGSTGGIEDTWEITEVCDYTETIPDYVTPFTDALTN